MNDLHQIIQRLRLPEFSQYFELMNPKHNKGGEYYSGKSDSTPLSLEEILRQKFPQLFEQYDEEDRGNPFQPRPVQQGSYKGYL